MSEKFKSITEHEADEREEKIVRYKDGGSSAIIVNEPGAIVDLYNDKHKYLTTPETGSTILITGYTEEGEKVKIVIDGNYVVAFGVDAQGKQFAEVHHTSQEDYEDLAEPIVIGEEGVRFNGLIIDSVGAEYKTLGGGAEGEPKGQNPFSIAGRLVELAKNKTARQ